MPARVAWVRGWLVADFARVTGCRAPVSSWAWASPAPLARARSCQWFYNICYINILLCNMLYKINYFPIAYYSIICCIAYYSIICCIKYNPMLYLSIICYKMSSTERNWLFCKAQMIYIILLCKFVTECHWHLASESWRLLLTCNLISWLYIIVPHAIKISQL